MNDTLSLPFDQYQRYRLVSALVDELREGPSGMTILDVGGRTALLRRFLGRDQVTLVDVEPSGEPGLVLGDGSALPFRDGSFDLVCAFDTLEHVPPAGRARFLEECHRVAKKHVVIAGPYQAPEVEEAEVLLQRFLKDKLGVEHRYLEEHRHHGLPDLASTEACLRSLGAQVASIGHGNVHRWLGLISLSMYIDYTPALQDLGPRLARFYNGALFATDTVAPVYRHAVVAAKQGARLPAAKLPKLPASAVPGARVIEGFAAELAAFDARRDGWEREWHRLEGVIRSLEKDLSEHKAALDEVRLRREELERVVATLESDLAGHRASVEDLRKELARYPGEIEAFQATVATLQSDLDRHREQAAELQGEIDALERERARLTEMRAAERGQAEERARALETDLEGHRSALTAVGRELAAHRETLDEERRLRASEGAALRSAIAEHERRLAEYADVVTAIESDLAGTRQTLDAVRAELAAVEAERVRLIELRARETAETLRQKHELDQDLAAQREQSRRFEQLFLQEQSARAADVDQLRRQQLSQSQVIETLQQDLKGHRAALAELGETHQRLREELQAVSADRAAIVADRAAIVADRAAIVADRAAIDADRKAARERIAQLEVLIGDQHEQLARASGKLLEQDTLIEQLRGELRSRWRSLKRVWGRKSTL